MPVFRSFAGYQVNVYAADHNPPHFHVVGPSGHDPNFEALIDLRTLQVMRGVIPRKVFAEVVAWAALHKVELLAEWRRLNERN